MIRVTRFRTLDGGEFETQRIAEVHANNAFRLALGEVSTALHGLNHSERVLWLGDNTERLQRLINLKADIEPAPEVEE